MTEKAYRIEKKITQVKKILTKLIKEHNFFCGERCEEEYKDIRTKAIYFICLELEDVSISHTEYVVERLVTYFKNYKGGYKQQRETFRFKIISKKIDIHFEDAIERTLARLNKRYLILEKNKLTTNI